MKRIAVATALLIGIGMFSGASAFGDESGKYSVGELCSPGFDPEKPKDIYCFTEEKAVSEGVFQNVSGGDIPAGTPIVIESKGSGQFIRIVDTKIDKEISGVTKERILNQQLGSVFIGNGDPKCREDFLDGRWECNYITNFDTSAFNKDDVLYVDSTGKISNKKSINSVVIGIVKWAGKAEFDSYTLDIGKVFAQEISTWKKYRVEGDSCDDLQESEILPSLRCGMDEEGLYLLFSKNPKKTIGDSLYEKTGFDPDGNSWLLILVSILLVAIIFSVIRESAKSLSESIGKTSLYAILLGLVLFSLTALIVNVITPLFKGNPVDFSKKIFGIPQYFYLLPGLLVAVLRNYRR
jgi:hypothetical protein